MQPTLEAFNNRKFRRKGPLCVAFVVTQHAKKSGLPLDPERLLTKGGGQVLGLDKGPCKQRWNVTASVVFSHPRVGASGTSTRAASRPRPRSSKDHWERKLNRNIARDRECRNALKALGWRVLVIWECKAGEPAALGVEVKTVVPATSDRILLSRNEFDVAQRMGNRWKVVQVVLSSQVIARGIATTEDVLQVRELASNALMFLLPPDVETFRWTEGAEFKPLPEMWQATDLTVPGGFTFKLGKE